jgi:hypothetical protein
MEACADTVAPLEAPEAPPETPLWDAVGRIIDRAASLDDHREHGLELLAARRWRALGRPVPAALAAEDRWAALRLLAVRPLLERLRASLDRPIVFKGPELAARYPDGSTRRFSDVDVLVADPAESQRALLAAGFEEVGDPALYEDIHHLRPLAWPSLPLAVELHSAPKWIEGAPAPRHADLLPTAVPARCGVDGILAPAPAEHAILVAVHSWAHEPLRRLADLVDVAVLAAEAAPGELDAAAAELGVARLWATTARAVEAALHGGATTWPTRTWARNVVAGRRRTVFESHLEQLLSPFAVAGAPRAAQASALAARDILFPRAEEAWREKLRRATHALRNARVPRSAHDQALGRKDLR